jgi:hypothetical protein
VGGAALLRLVVGGAGWCGTHDAHCTLARHRLLPLPLVQALDSFGASADDIKAMVAQITQMLKLEGAAVREQLPEELEVNDGVEPFTIGGRWS